MAIQIDPSSPAGIVFDPDLNGTAQSGQFSPPANSVLVACVFANEGSVTPATNIGVSNNVTPRTWTQRVRRDEGDAGSRPGLVAIFTAPNPTALTNVRVTATTNWTNGIGVRVYVVTGVDLDNPVAATGEGSSTSNNITPTGYTSTVANSLGIAAASDTSDLGAAATSTDVETAAYDTTTGLSAISVYKAAATPTPGTGVTFNFDADGASAVDWNWCAVELRPAATDAEAALSTITATTSVPAPAVSAGSSTTLGPVAATTAVPAPAVSAGAGPTPASVPVTAAVPNPAVTTDSAEVVTIGPIPVAAAVPAPAVQASSNLTPGSVAAAATVWGLDVIAEFNAEVLLPHVPVTVTADGVVASVPPLPGDNIDRPGQIEWNGFLLGSTTPYRWLNLVGWRDRPPVDSGNVPRASRHGSWAGRPLLQERTITWTALLRAPREEIEAALGDLEQALPVLDDETEHPLVINDLGTPYLIYGRIDRLALPVDKQLRLGLGQLTLQWICSDPRRYNILATGITIPIGEEREVANGGNIATHPLLVVHGPVTDPKVTNVTLNRVVEFDVVLTAGQQLIIDCDLGNATIDGTDVMGQLTGSSVHPSDFVLGRGSNTIAHTAASGGVAVDVLYRDAWA